MARHEQQTSDQPIVEPKALQAPTPPTEVERAQHLASGHAVFNAWCPACVAGRGIADRHVVADVGEEALARVGLDYGFLGSEENATRIN